MPPRLPSERTDSADICVDYPTAQRANTSLTDEAKVHLPDKQQRHCCQPKEIKRHKTSLTIRHNCTLFTRVVQCLCPPQTHTVSEVPLYSEYLAGASVCAQDARPRSISGYYRDYCGPPSLPIGTGGVKLANVKLATHIHTLRQASWCGARRYEEE
jgi:hypothetical protein